MLYFPKKHAEALVGYSKLRISNSFKKKIIIIIVEAEKEELKYLVVVVVVASGEITEYSMKKSMNEK